MEVGWGNVSEHCNNSKSLLNLDFREYIFAKFTYLVSIKPEQFFHALVDFNIGFISEEDVMSEDYNS